MAVVGQGKIILFGEHAVVHGCPALAMALPNGCRASAQPAGVDELYLEPLGAHVVLGAEPADEGAATLQKAFATAFENVSTSRPRLCVRAELQVPAGAGLGASAAISVAVARAIDEAIGTVRDQTELIEASLRWERVFHGNPSGVDSTMAVMGGVALYRRGRAVTPLSVPRLPTIVVGYSGSAPSTRLMVDSVARQLEADRALVGGMFKDIESIVVAGQDALVAGDLPCLGRLMDENQSILKKLQLSTQALDAMMVSARDAGALGAKLTGGGGGGCMIALCPDAAASNRVCSALNSYGRAFVVETSQ